MRGNLINNLRIKWALNWTYLLTQVFAVGFDKSSALCGPACSLPSYGVKPIAPSRAPSPDTWLLPLPPPVSLFLLLHFLLFHRVELELPHARSHGPKTSKVNIFLILQYTWQYFQKGLIIVIVIAGGSIRICPNLRRLLIPQIRLLQLHQLQMSSDSTLNNICLSCSIFIFNIDLTLCITF